MPIRNAIFFNYLEVDHRLIAGALLLPEFYAKFAPGTRLICSEAEGGGNGNGWVTNDDGIV